MSEQNLILSTFIKLIITIIALAFIIGGLIASNFNFDYEVKLSILPKIDENKLIFKTLYSLVEKLELEESYPKGEFFIEDGFLDLRHPFSETFFYSSDGEKYSIVVKAIKDKGYFIQESEYPTVKDIEDLCKENWTSFGNRCVMDGENINCEDINTRPITELEKKVFEIEYDTCAY